MDPKASRETLDHSIMYIFAVALEDGKWHHIDSYTPERANTKSTVELWKKIKTFDIEDGSMWGLGTPEDLDRFVKEHGQ